MRASANTIFLSANKKIIWINNNFDYDADFDSHTNTQTHGTPTTNKINLNKLQTQYGQKLL